MIRSGGQRIWSFPMWDAAGRVVGIRLRAADGRKYAVAGGREGLFIPNDLPPRPGQLLIAEGPTDTAALLDLGFAAVGRPSCTGGITHLVRLVQASRPDGVVVVADADVPGQRGAKAQAATLVAYVPRLRVIAPPEQLEEAWQRRDALARSLDLFRRGRMLPEGPVLEKVSRYEAAPERGLYKALHELQRMQAARRGQAVPPPAAVDADVSGIGG